MAIDWEGIVVREDVGCACVGPDDALVGELVETFTSLSQEEDGGWLEKGYNVDQNIIGELEHRRYKVRYAEVTLSLFPPTPDTKFLFSPKNELHRSFLLFLHLNRPRRC